MRLDEELFADGRVKSLARKLARRTEAEGPLPPEIVVPAREDEWPAIRRVGRILGIAAFLKGRNAVFAVPLDRRNPSAPSWVQLRAAFAPSAASDGGAEETFRRARLIAGGDAVEALKEDASISRFVRRGKDEARDFLRLLEWATGHMDAIAATTLSQLGSDVLDDSKALRSGTRRAVFEKVLAAVAGLDCNDAHNALSRFGIEENPFTSSATVFAPFAFVLDTGETFGYPEGNFSAGLAVQLPWQTVQRMREVRLGEGVRVIVTSENAAPFERMVRMGIPCLYTAGYPNAAVLRLLELFAAQGVKAVHAGDGDLDGFLIADRVASAVQVVRVVADDIADSGDVSRRPVAPNARRRWETYLSTHSGFAHARALRLALEHGWTEQESYPIEACLVNSGQ